MLAMYILWQASSSSTALFHPKTSIANQKHHPYCGNLNSEMSADSKIAFAHCGGVLAQGSEVHANCYSTPDLMHGR